MPPKDKKSAAPWPPPIPIGKRNIQLYLLGLVVLVVGYIVLSIGPWDNPLSRSVAPLILLLAYLVIFPLAVMAKDKKAE